MNGMDEQQAKINASMRDVDTRHLEAAGAAMLKLTEYGITPDTLELLVLGNTRAGQPPESLWEDCRRLAGEGLVKEHPFQLGFFMPTEAGAARVSDRIRRVQ